MIQNEAVDFEMMMCWNILVQLLICSNLEVLEMKLLLLRAPLKIVVFDLKCLEVMGLDLMVSQNHEEL